MAGAGAAAVAAISTLVAPDPLAGSELVFTSSGSGDTDSWQTFAVPVPEGARLSANLDWNAGSSANLNLFLKDQAGTDIAFANTTTAKPERVARNVPAGSYTLAVKIKKGSPESAFTLSVDLADLTAPTAPAAVTAASRGASVDVSWPPATDGFGVTSYAVTVGTATAEVTGTAVTVPGVGDGVQPVSVVALDAAGNRSSAATTQVTVDATPPARPAALAVGLSGSSATASWQPGGDPADVAAYEVVLDGSPRTVGGTSVVLGPLADGVHTIDVVALDAAQNRSEAASSSFTVDVTAPSVPGDLSAAAAGHDVSVSWSPSSDALGVVAYDVTVGAITGSTSATSLSVAGAPEGLLPVTVVARDAAGNRSPAAQSMVGVYPPAPAPVAGSEFTFSGTGTAGESSSYPIQVTTRSAVTATVDWTAMAGGAVTWTSGSSPAGRWPRREPPVAGPRPPRSCSSPVSTGSPPP